jgi:hypothetical protein
VTDLQRVSITEYGLTRWVGFAVGAPYTGGLRQPAPQLRHRRVREPFGVCGVSVGDTREQRARERERGTVGVVCVQLAQNTERRVATTAPTNQVRGGLADGAGADVRGAQELTKGSSRPSYPHS